MSKIREEALSLQDEIVRWRRKFHQIPELGLKTFTTGGAIAAILKGFGIERVEPCLDGAGVIAVIEGSLPGKCLGIRADCDGLPVKEETGLAFASGNDCMHACGHDAHVAIGLGAAKILQNHRESLRGSVKLLFQPGEETGEGARAMIAAGVLENPHVDGMIALHVGTAGDPSAHSGQLCYHPDAASFCSTAFQIDIQGKGGHAALPHECVDPLLTACYLVTQLQSVLSRETAPWDSVVLGIQQIESGTRHNIIPESASMKGSLRTVRNELSEHYEHRIEEISRLTGDAMRCRTDYHRLGKVAGCTNAPEMTESLLKAAGAILDPEDIVQSKRVPSGGEDFGFFAEQVPSVYFFLSTALEEGNNYPHHHPRFDIDESVLWRGSAVFAEFALCWQEQ